MSTGATCHFIEKNQNKWYYELQDWPYGECSEYSTYGVFSTYESAVEHLVKNHANPGGWSVSEYIETKSIHYQAPSNIHGTGTFISANVEADTRIGCLVHYRGGATLTGLEVTDFGAKINHQTACNSYLVKEENNYWLHSLKKISAGEEITLNYKDLPSFLDDDIEDYKELT
jgi:hypothetical protein